MVQLVEPEAREDVRLLDEAARPPSPLVGRAVPVAAMRPEPPRESLLATMQEDVAGFGARDVPAAVDREAGGVAAGCGLGGGRFGGAGQPRWDRTRGNERKHDASTGTLHAPNVAKRAHLGCRQG